MVYTGRMSLGCIHLRSSLARGPTRMTGLNVPLFTLMKMLGGVIQESIITAMFLALIFTRVHARGETHVNMHMEFLSAGFTLPNIVLVCARTRLIVQEGYVSLPTNLKSYGPCMLPLVQQCLPLDHSLPVLRRLILHQSAHSPLVLLLS